MRAGQPCGPSRRGNRRPHVLDTIIWLLLCLGPATAGSPCLIQDRRALLCASLARAGEALRVWRFLPAFLIGDQEVALIARRIGIIRRRHMSLDMRVASIEREYPVSYTHLRAHATD